MPRGGDPLNGFLISSVRTFGKGREGRPAFGRRGPGHDVAPRAAVRYFVTSLLASIVAASARVIDAVGRSSVPPEPSSCGASLMLPPE